jgi:cell division protein FtsI/penicillin-binding protein 2
MGSSVWQPTGIDIEGESTGVLPSPEWKRRFRQKPEQQKWFGGETISIGIGQGYTTPPCSWPMPPPRWRRAG